MQISSHFRSIIQIFKSVCNKFGLSLNKLETFVEIQTNRIGVNSAAEVFSLYIKNFNQTRGDKELSKFNKSQNDINNIIELISNIRSTKAELKITPKLYCNIFFNEKSGKLKKLVSSNFEMIKQVGRINNILKSKSPSKNSIDILVSKEKITLCFNEDINLSGQKERISKKIETISNQILNLKNKLNNKAFITNAPKEIVQNDKNSIKELTIEDQKLRSIVSSIN